MNKQNDSKSQIKLSLDLNKPNEFKKGNDLLPTPIQTPTTPGTYRPGDLTQNSTNHNGYLLFATEMDKNVVEKKTEYIPLRQESVVENCSQGQIESQNCVIDISNEVERNGPSEGSIHTNRASTCSTAVSTLHEVSSSVLSEDGSGRLSCPQYGCNGQNNIYCGPQHGSGRTGGQGPACQQQTCEHCQHVCGKLHETTVHIDHNSTNTLLSSGDSNPDKQYCCSKRQKFYILCTSVVVLVILFSLLASIATTVFHKQSHSDDVGGLCVKCTDLPEDARPEMEQRGYFCCASTPHQLELLMDSSAYSPTSEYRVQHPSHDHMTIPAVIINSNDTNTAIAALQLASNTSSLVQAPAIVDTSETATLDERHGEALITTWSSNYDITAKGNGYDYKYNTNTNLIDSIVIREEGKYNVHLRATIKGYKDDDSFKPAHIMYSHVVKLYNPGHMSGADEILREQRYVTCPPEVGTTKGCNTIDSHRVLHLRKGDEISVRIAQTDLLVTDSTFFSIVKL